MPFKPNYNQQRAERTRAKQAKKDAKLRERENEVARRRAAQEQQDDDGQPVAPDQPPSGETRA